MCLYDKVELKPIGFVKRETSEKNLVSKIILKEDLIEALEGIDDFSHFFVLFWMHNISPVGRNRRKVHPRGRRDLPLLGVFSTRTPYRPNPIGLTLVELLQVDSNILTVRGLDAFDGTPVLDLKPFDPWDVTQDARVPEWWQKLENERSETR